MSEQTNVPMSKDRNGGKSGIALLLICSVVGTAILFGLGYWQLERRAWKNNLVANMTARSAMPPKSLDEVNAAYSKTGEVDFFPVRVSGRFDYTQERHLFTVEKGTPGWRVITPFYTKNDTAILVDRGFVPDRLKDKKNRQSTQSAHEQTVIGIVRMAGRKNYFTPTNDPSVNKWYWRDLKAMLPPQERDKTAITAYLLEAEGDHQSSKGQWPKPGKTRKKFPNRHLEYAVTWFALGLVLIVITTIFARNRLNNS